jgi:hypothetical protein
MTLFLTLALLVQSDSPVKSLLEIGKRLDAGAAEFMKGTAPAECFKGWAWPAKEDGAKLKEALKGAGVTKLENLGFEFELVYLKGGKPLYYLRTFVYMEGDSATFLAFRGEKLTDTDTASSRAKTLDQYEDAFAGAAKALVEAIKAKKADAIVFADPDKIAKRCVFEGLVKDAQKQIEEGKKALAETVSTVAALDHDEVRLILDDQMFLGLAEDGTPTGGVKASWAWEEGKLGFALGRWRAFKK